MDTVPQLMRVTWDHDRLIVPIPWDRADAIQTYLRGHDVESTLCLEPIMHEAHLELSTNLGAEAVQVLLDRWEG